MEKWIESVRQNNHCLVINDMVKTSKKSAFDFIEKPAIKSSDESYLEVIRPETGIEKFLYSTISFQLKIQARSLLLMELK